MFLRATTVYWLVGTGLRSCSLSNSKVSKWLVWQKGPEAHSVSDNIFPASSPTARSSPVRSQHPTEVGKTWRVMVNSCVGEPSLAPQPEPIATLLPPLLRVKGRPDSKESRLPIRWPLYYTGPPSPTAFCWFIQPGVNLPYLLGQNFSQPSDPSITLQNKVEELGVRSEVSPQRTSFTRSFNGLVRATWHKPVVVNSKPQEPGQPGLGHGKDGMGSFCSQE